jgi:hypothetical protein
MGNNIIGRDYCCCGCNDKKPNYSNLESFTTASSLTYTECLDSGMDSIEGLQVVKALIHEDVDSEEMLKTYLKKYLDNLSDEVFLERLTGVLSTQSQPLSSVFWKAFDTMEGVYEQTEIASWLTSTVRQDDNLKFLMLKIEDPLLSRALKALRVGTHFIGTYKVHAKKFHHELLIVERIDRYLIAVQSITVLDYIQSVEVRIMLDTVNDKVRVSFFDLETSFQGLYDFNNCRIVGTSTQIKGLDQGAEGSFELLQIVYGTPNPLRSTIGLSSEVCSV